MYSDLIALRDALADIPEVCTCKIGIEANLSTASFPMIRVVPSRAIPGRPYNNRTVELTIYFGYDITESAGLEKVYEKLLEMEGEIIVTLQAQGLRYLDTIADEDRGATSGYKWMAIRAEMSSERPDQ